MSQSIHRTKWQENETKNDVPYVLEHALRQMKDLKKEFGPKTVDNLVQAAAMHGQRETLIWLKERFESCATRPVIRLFDLSPQTSPQIKELLMDLVEERAFQNEKQHFKIAIWAIRHSSFRTIDFLLQNTTNHLTTDDWAQAFCTSRSLDISTLTFLLTRKTNDSKWKATILTRVCHLVFDIPDEQKQPQCKRMLAYIITEVKALNGGDVEPMFHLCRLFLERLEPSQIDLCEFMLLSLPELLPRYFACSPKRLVAHLCTVIFVSGKSRYLLSLALDLITMFASPKQDDNEAQTNVWFQLGFTLGWQEELRKLLLRTVCASDYPEEAFWFMRIMDVSITDTGSLADSAQRLKYDNWSDPKRYSLSKPTEKEWTTIHTCVLASIARDTQKFKTREAFLQTNRRVRFLHTLANRFGVYTPKDRLETSLFSIRQSIFGDEEDTRYKQLYNMLLDAFDTTPEDVGFTILKDEQNTVIHVLNKHNTTTS